MHISNGTSAPWTRRVTAAVAMVVTAAAPALADDASSLAQAISYEAAELWRASATRAADAGQSEPLSTAYYSTPVSHEPIAASAQAGEPCESCNEYGPIGGYPYNRCGCSSYALFPYFTGPGACDDWCVGPHWEVAVDGLIMFREGVDWASVPAGAGYALILADQFNYGPGARAFVTGYNENEFGIQVGYEGVNDFHANALYTNGPDMRSIAYESNFNSLEVNFLRRTQIPWRPFAGVRYIELDENFVDFTTVDKPIPPPADPPAAPAAYVDTGAARFLENRLIGLQAGAFRDMWRLNRWITIEPWGNAGVYLNDYRRADQSTTVTTVITGDDLSTPGNEFSESVSEVQTGTIQEFSELAFVGEAGVTGVLRLNRCLALRGGYQVFVVNGVGTGIDAFLAPGLEPTTLVYHGGHFGIEYVR